jgi:hypothetical protein
MNIKQTSSNVKKEKLIYKNLIKRFFIKKTCDVYILFVQWTPLNGITLGQTISDPFNRMIPITEHVL